MSLQRLFVLYCLQITLGTVNAAETGPVTVLGLPEFREYQKGASVIGKSGGSITYKISLPPLSDAPGEVWTVTNGPNTFIAHNEVSLSPNEKEVVDQKCAVVQESIIQACSYSLSGDGLTPELQQEAAERNKMPPETYPVDGPEAFTLMRIAIGADAPGPTPGQAGGAPIAPATATGDSGSSARRGAPAQTSSKPIL
jgi:hypothetical protein